MSNSNTVSNSKKQNPSDDAIKAPHASVKKTHFVAYEVSGEEGDKTWKRVATLFPFKNGGGFHLNINEGLSLSGQLVILPPKDPSK